MPKLILYESDDHFTSCQVIAQLMKHTKDTMPDITDKVTAVRTPSVFSFPFTSTLND